jgi:hypothetical protein
LNRHISTSAHRSRLGALTATAGAPTSPAPPMRVEQSLSVRIQLTSYSLFLS